MKKKTEIYILLSVLVAMMVLYVTILFIVFHPYYPEEAAYTDRPEDRPGFQSPEGEYVPARALTKLISWHGATTIWETDGYVLTYTRGPENDEMTLEIRRGDDVYIDRGIDGTCDESNDEDAQAAYERIVQELLSIHVKG